MSMGSQASCPRWLWAAELRLSRGDLLKHLSLWKFLYSFCATPPPAKWRHTLQCECCHCQVMSSMSKLSIMQELKKTDAWNILNHSKPWDNLTGETHGAHYYEPYSCYCILLFASCLEREEQSFFLILSYNITAFALLARQLCKMNQVKSSKIKGPGVAEMMTYVLFETLDLI